MNQWLPETDGKGPFFGIDRDAKPTRFHLPSPRPFHVRLWRSLRIAWRSFAFAWRCS
jgi:hypothetical protein